VFDGEVTMGGWVTNFVSDSKVEAAGIVLVPQVLRVIPHLSISRSLLSVQLSGPFILQGMETAVQWAMDAPS
jgi:ABC-type sugar transport system ATPase subunit